MDTDQKYLSATVIKSPVAQNSNFDLSHTTT